MLYEIPLAVRPDDSMTTADTDFLSAGEALAIAVGLLLPHAQQQRAAEERLQLLAHLPGPADVSLIATLLARRLWPQAAASPAYPQLAQSLLDHGALAAGECSWSPDSGNDLKVE